MRESCWQSRIAVISDLVGRPGIDWQLTLFPSGPELT